MLLLPGLPAQAIDYSIPGYAPSDVTCVGLVCTTISIPGADTITIGPGVHITGSITTADGNITLGEGVWIDGSLSTDSGFVKLGNLVKIGGSITAAKYGSIGLGNAVAVLGTISTNVGDVTVGDQAIVATVTGAAVSTTNGNITFGIQAQVGSQGIVSGGVTATIGKITFGEQGHVYGGVTATQGDVYFGQTAWIYGAITATAGDVSFSDFGRMCGAITDTRGNVDVGQSVWIGAAITATSGYVALKDLTQIVGAISTINFPLTMGNDVQVVGAITSTSGNITYGDRLGHAAAIVTGGSVYSGKDAYTAVTVIAACTNAPPFSSASAIAFECLEAGASYVNIQRVPSAHVPLYTKLAGTAFAFDLVALKADGTIESDYVASGGNSKNVKLELVDGSDRTACADRSLITPIVSQSLSFSATDAGRKQSATMTVSNAYANLRCRVTDSNQTPSVVACSSDNFAVRPLALLVTQNTPTLNAGSTFTLQAQAVMDYLTPPTTATNYSGVPALNPGQITGTPGFTQTALAPQPFPTATNGISNATFTYDEVGSFTLPASAPSTYGISDSSFTGVDGSTDCIPNSASNTLDSSGKYGCLIGQSAALTVGRFYPDHFDIASAVTPGCPAGGFTYMDQPFTLGYTVTAKSMSRGSPNPPGNLPLTLYSGGQLYFAAINAGTDWVTRLSSAVTTPLTPTWINGSYTQASKPMTFTRPTTATADATWGPFDALDIGVAIDDADSVGYAATIPTFSAKTPTQCSNSAGTACRQYASLTGGTTTKMRIGRIRLSNAYGSERLNLIIPMALEYWTTNGWQKNSLDTCTPFTNSNFSFSFPSGTTTKPNNLVACNTALTFTGRASTYVQTLSAPGVGKTGWADISLNLGTTSFGAQCVALGSAGGPANPLAMPWLQFGGISANANPSARATFGIFKSPMIYRRENY